MKLLATLSDNAMHLYCIFIEIKDIKFYSCPLLSIIPGGTCVCWGEDKFTGIHEHCEIGIPSTEGVDWIVISDCWLINLLITYLFIFHDRLSGVTDESASGSEYEETDGTTTVNRDTFNRGYRYLGRVLRASLPFQCCLLAVLGIATWLGMPSDSSNNQEPCEFVDGFGSMFKTVLRYRNGPPPS